MPVRQTQNPAVFQGGRARKSHRYCTLRCTNLVHEAPILVVPFPQKIGHGACDAFGPHARRSGEGRTARFPHFSPLPEVPLTYPSFSLPLPSQHLSGVSFCALCGDREAPTRHRTFRATTCRPLCGKARPAPVQLRVPTGVFRIRRGVGRRTVHAEV